MLDQFKLRPGLIADANDEVLKIRVASVASSRFPPDNPGFDLSQTIVITSVDNGLGGVIPSNGNLQFGTFDNEVVRYAWNQNKTSYRREQERVEITARFVDGKVRLRFGRHHLEFFFETFNILLLNLAVGGAWPSHPDASTAFPQEYRIDYVRVYERRQDREPGGWGRGRRSGLRRRRIRRQQGRSQRGRLLGCDDRAGTVCQRQNRRCVGRRRVSR